MSDGKRDLNEDVSELKRLTREALIRHYRAKWERLASAGIASPNANPGETGESIPGTDTSGDFNSRKQPGKGQVDLLTPQGPTSPPVSNRSLWHRRSALGTGPTARSTPKPPDIEWTWTKDRRLTIEWEDR